MRKDKIENINVKLSDDLCEVFLNCFLVDEENFKKVEEGGKIHIYEGICQR